MTTILNGVLGGLVVGTVAAVATRFVVDEPSAVAALERAVAPRTARWLAVAAWSSYGALAGGALVALELYVVGVLGVPPTAVAAFGVAVAWSAILLGLLSLVWRVAFSAEDERSRAAELVVFHLVYGIGLGLWIRTTWIT